MSCFHPLPAFRPRTGGAPRIGFDNGRGDKLELPCGRCVGCRQDRARSWSIRCMHEASLYDANAFVTLDYAPEHLPASLSLEYRDFQSFVKRLRKRHRGVSVDSEGKRPIRFFCAGEYGEKFRRPHWHAILFNFWPRDSVGYVNGTYRSADVEDLWRCGQVVIGHVTPESAAYVAGYTLSKRYGSLAEDHYEDVVNPFTGEVSRRRPEFCTMSRRPGIGAAWFDKFGGDLFPHDIAVQSGKTYKVPRYYWEKFRDRADGEVVEEVEHRRFLRAAQVDRHESSVERRQVREQVAKARLKTFSERDH